MEMETEDIQTQSIDTTKCADERCRCSAFRAWLPVVLWMTVIFVASTDLMSSAHTSRIIGPVLRWLIPGISDNAIGNVQFIVRKGGHMTEYAILAGLFWRARRKTRDQFPSPRPSPEGRGGMAFSSSANSGELSIQTQRRPLWSAKEAWIAIGFACFYAMTDEFHQYFVASRDASVRDVMIDTAGAMLGMGLIRRFGQLKKWW